MNAAFGKNGGLLQTAVEAAELLAARSELDPLRDLALGDDPGLFAHQDRFLKSEKSETWLFGANRSGKTKVLAAAGAALLRYGIPDPRPAYVGNGNWIYDRAVAMWAISLKYDQSRNILQPYMFNNGAGVGIEPFIPASEVANWNVTNQTLRLKNGSECIFKSADSGRDAFPGTAKDHILFDEVPPKEVYGECAMRVGGGRALRIWGAATILPPPGEQGGVSWMYADKVRPWIAGGKNDPNLEIITASIYDNPTILPEELERMESLYQPGSPEYLIRMKGELLASIGGSLVYPGFHAEFHMQEDVPVVPNLPLVLTVDFNPENGVWLVGQKVGQEFRILDEITLERSDIPSMVHAFRASFPNHSGELWIYGDATGRRRHQQTGEADFFLVQEHLQNYPSPIRFCLPDVNPPVRDRVAAVNRLFSPGDGVRRIIIDSRCTKLQDELERTVWKADGKINKTICRSDGPDSLGYWVVYEAPVPRYVASPNRLTSIRRPTYFQGQSGQVFPYSRGGRARGPRYATA